MTEKKITAIVAQKHNPGRLNIDLDGDFAFGISRITAAWLKIGDSLSEEKVDSLRRSDLEEVAFQKAIKFVDYRARTEKEIRQRLNQKGIGPEEIETVIQRLRENGLIEDQKYAKMWIENRNEFHPRSQRLIRYELRNKGITEEMIDHALEGSAKDIDQAEAAAIRFARKLTNLEWLEFRKKLSAFLARRGFSYGTIAPVVKSVWNSEGPALSQNLENKENENGKSK
ncbi:MAG: RecX family transcriptional regulator [Chloroflexi bacterium]|nr:RecX family transcriptional regulator [Chloroflexota bacterium]